MKVINSATMIGKIDYMEVEAFAPLCSIAVGCGQIIRLTANVTRETGKCSGKSSCGLPCIGAGPIAPFLHDIHAPMRAGNRSDL